MNTTRLGKIARLPRFIRQQLNTRLEDGMSGEKLLAWVNGLPETQEMLADEFDGKPINKQNLSDWRLGGHQDWVRAREDCELAASLAERAQELGESAPRPGLSEGLGMLLTLHLARQVRAWQSDTSDPKERWPQLREMLRELALLRREDSRAQRTEIARQKWAKQAEAMAEEKQEKLMDAAFAEAAWRRAVADTEPKSKSRRSGPEARKPKSKAQKPKRERPRKKGNQDTETHKPKEGETKLKSDKILHSPRVETPAEKDEKIALRREEPETKEKGEGQGAEPEASPDESSPVKASQASRPGRAPNAPARDLSEFGVEFPNLTTGSEGETYDESCVKRDPQTE